MPIYKPTLLENRLSDFDPRVRRDALAALQALTARQHPAPPSGNVNMHCHSFFSYNADGWSPTRIAWACHRQGLYAAALCDFDVLDGLDEFLRAGLTLGLRTAVHLETRAFLAPYASQDINSPGEPGVTYIMGAGFVAKPASDTPQGRGLAQFRESAAQRNLALIRRINAKLPAIRIDYARDVLPLTPLKVATERHIVRAYVARARNAFPDDPKRAAFWAPLLRRKPAECLELEGTPAKFEEAVRGALAKRGGIGYVQPDATTFPPAQDFVAWVLSCAAIPMITWLDGTSAGESDPRAMFGLLRDQGCAALNIIPDRNWNLAKPEDRKLKVAKLDQAVRTARAMDLPLNVGTEMNRAGLPFVDDLRGEVLRTYRDDFLAGAQVMVGHTLLSRYADMPYTGQRARAEFRTRKARNAFYAEVGALPALTHEDADKLLDAGPEHALSLLRDKARQRARKARAVSRA